MRTLIAIPVFNEAKTVRRVLESVLRHAGNVLVVDDGSTDATPAIVSELPVDVIRHCVNRGYGQSLIDAFHFAHNEGYDWVVTMDADEQHEPDKIPNFIAAADRGVADILSGSRYKVPGPRVGTVPPERRRVNSEITRELNDRLGLDLTDAFCGFKAHRVGAMQRLSLTETGYAFPMQLWVQAAAAGLRIAEIPVDLIYNDPNRSFGAHLDDAGVRLAHYREVMHREIARHRDQLSPAASWGLVPQYTGR
ncbi:MAG: glycosyltransferase family 2 protein [Planctomycetota bacterium]